MVVAFTASSLCDAKDIESLLLAGLRRAQAPALSGAVHSLPLTGHRTTKPGCGSLDRAMENGREDNSEVQGNRKSRAIERGRAGCDPGAADRTPAPQEAWGQAADVRSIATALRKSTRLCSLRKAAPNHFYSKLCFARERFPCPVHPSRNGTPPGEEPFPEPEPQPQTSDTNLQHGSCVKRFKT